MSRAVFVLPEDSARDAVPIMRRLVEHALSAAEVRSASDLREAPGPVAAMAVGRRWAGKRIDRVSFVQWLAARMRLGQVVVLHYDADVPWSKRRRCKHHIQFEKLVRGPASKLSATKQLVEMVPFATIEAWTYRNTTRALEWSDRHVLHSEAAADSSLLEERTDLKRTSPLRDSYNLRLVTEGWPAAHAYADGRSFRAFADALSEALRS